MLIFSLSFSDRLKLIDELITASQDSTVGDYIRELWDIENEINRIQNNTDNDKDQAKAL